MHVCVFRGGGHVWGACMAGGMHWGHAWQGGCMCMALEGAHVKKARKWYASHWNAFLLRLVRVVRQMLYDVNSSGLRGARGAPLRAPKSYVGAPLGSWRTPPPPPGKILDPLLAKDTVWFFVSAKYGHNFQGL